MYSISFPNFLSNTRTKLVKDKDAVRSNMFLVLSSYKGTLFGDPDFGSNIRRALFEQNDAILVDLLIDDIYTTITTYMPQVYITRNDITITSDKADLFLNVRYVYRIDGQTDLYTINLTSDEEL